MPFEGGIWQIPDLRGLPPPARPDGPTLWYAGVGPAGLALAATDLDGWLPYPPSSATYGAALDDLQAMIRQARRPPTAVTPALYVTVLSGNSSATSRELDRYFSAYYGAGLEHIQPLQAVIHGHPDQCLDQLRSYIAAGARHVVVRIGSLDAHAHLPAIADCLLPARHDTDPPEEPEVAVGPAPTDRSADAPPAPASTNAGRHGRRSPQNGTG